MSRRIQVTNMTELAGAVRLATEVLSSGGMVLYPTDTTYALGVNALNMNAIDHVFQVKGRDYSKPIHVIVKNIEHAAQYVELGEAAKRIAGRFLPGALTLVLPQKPNSPIPPLLVAGATTLGIRIPDHLFCAALWEAIDFPVTTTSANRSGMPSTYSVDHTEKQLGYDFNQIDLVIDMGILDSGRVSTVISIEREVITLIREGSIPFAQITEFVSSYHKGW